MLSILSSFFLFLPFFRLIHASVNINSYFQTPCGSSVPYQPPPTSDYLVEDYNFSICSNIFLQSSASNSSIQLLIRRASFYVEEGVNLTLSGINIETDYSGNNGLGSVFWLGKNATLLIKVK